MGSVTGHDLVPGPSIAVPAPDLAEIAEETKDQANQALEATLTALQAAGATARGRWSPTTRSTPWPPRSPRSTAARRSS